jgi:hypothetical protein
MNHLRLTATQLHRAYQEELSKPLQGGWYHYDVEEERVYQCPLNLIYGSDSIQEAVEMSGAARDCIVSWMLGWEDKEDADPKCQRCYRLGVRMLAALKPEWIDPYMRRRPVRKH